MTTLMNKEKKFQWSKEYEKAFETLKDRLTSAPLFALPDPSLDYMVYSDASKYGLGCVTYARSKGYCLRVTSFELNMRQRRWLELLPDYDLDFTYHEGKANWVANALSRKTTHSVRALIGSTELIRDFTKMNLEIIRDGELPMKLNALCV